MIILKDRFLKFVIQHRHFFRKLGCMQSVAAFQCAFPVGKEGFDYKETNNFRVSLKDQRPRPCQIHKYTVGSHSTTELTIHMAQCTLLIINVTLTIASDWEPCRRLIATQVVPRRSLAALSRVEIFSYTVQLPQLGGKCRHTLPGNIC